MHTQKTTQPEPLEIMRLAVRDEYENPLHRESGPDWQAAIVHYLSLGGPDMEPDDLQQLHRWAQDEEGIDY